jgi:hypothetical protein
MTSGGYEILSACGSLDDSRLGPLASTMKAAAFCRKGVVGRHATFSAPASDARASRHARDEDRYPKQGKRTRSEVRSCLI